jgi:hypothetical protein
VRFATDSALEGDGFEPSLPGDFLAQTFVILDRVAGVAVMCGRPPSEIGRQLTTSVLQALLIGGELKIHASGPPQPLLPPCPEARAIASIK